MGPNCNFRVINPRVGVEKGTGLLAWKRTTSPVQGERGTTSPYILYGKLQAADVVRGV